MPPREFTPEISEDFFKRLSRRIESRGERDVGRARAEALAGGFSNDPAGQAGVASSRNRTAEELADLDAELAYRVAGLNRQERIGTENREDVQSFQAGKADKDRAFRERLARLGFDFQADQAKTAARRGLQTGLIKLGAGVAGKAAGSYLGF